MLGRAVTLVALLASMGLVVGCVGDRTVVIGTGAPEEPLTFKRISPDRPRSPRDTPLRPGPVTRRGMPLVIAQPAAVVFPLKQTLSKSSSPLHIKNIGTAPLRIEKLTLSGDPAFSVRAAGPKSWLINAKKPELTPDQPLVIAPGQAWMLIVQHEPTGYALSTAMLQVRTNDPSREVSLKVSIRANAEESCLALSPSKVMDFEQTDVGTCKTRLLQLRNCGGSAVVIEDAGLINAAPQTPFSVSWGGASTGQPWIDEQLSAGSGAAVVLKAKETLDIAVTYCPSKPLPTGAFDSAQLAVVASAPGPHTVALKGTPRVPTCPKAVAGVAQVQAAQVGTLLQLTSHDSKASSGGISKWQWTLQAPPSSTAKLMPSAKVPTPSLVVDVAGSYTFCVDVWDDANKKSCQTSCLTVHATETATYQPGNYGAGPVW